MLRLTFLGTGTSQGVPMIGCDCQVCRSADYHDKRLRSSVMVERLSDEGSTEACIVIDAGPDFRYQMLREGVRSLDAILLTHEHKDHIAGIDDVRAFNYFDNRAIPIYATEQVAKIVRKDFDYAFTEQKYPGAPEIDLQIVDPEKPFDVAGFRVTPVSGMHYYLPVTGYRIGNMAYLTDFNHISDEEILKIKNIEVLVVNALRHDKHISHFTVGEAIETAKRIGAHHTYLTHMSHQIGLHEEMSSKLPSNVSYAYDSLVVDIKE